MSSSSTPQIPNDSDASTRKARGQDSVAAEISLRACSVWLLTLLFSRMREEENHAAERSTALREL
jgi:hypothetical protein